MKFYHNQICTSNKEVVEGNLYQYYEDGWVCQVNCKRIVDSKEFIEFELLVTEVSAGSLFSVGEGFKISAAKGNFAYSGMWRLYDNNEYIINGKSF